MCNWTLVLPQITVRLLEENLTTLMNYSLIMTIDVMFITAFSDINMDFSLKNLKHKDLNLDNHM
jgi:hypothetical protein